MNTETKALRLIEDFYNLYLPFEEMPRDYYRDMLDSEPNTVYEIMENLGSGINDGSKDFEIVFDNMLDAIYEAVLCHED